jgi:type IV pilus assembly protein PilC
MSTATSTPSATDLRFRWRGVDANGAKKSGALIAPDAGAARAILKRDNLFIVELAARGPAPRPKTRATDVTVFTRQLASLLRAGLPLAPSLELLAQAQSSRRQGMPRIVGALARDM